MSTDPTAWRAGYIARMVERGVEYGDAVATFKAAEHDYSDDPAEAADAEMECWTDDEGSET